MPDMGHLELTLAELSDRLGRREVSSREATEASLAAIDRLQPKLNCFIHVEAEAALAQADAADRELEAGRRRSPLHGVPLAHKDILYRAGRRSTCGSKILADYRPDTTAHVLSRLDAAGAVDLGGLNLAEFCVGPTGHNDHFGHCRNPWDTARVSGGSSSGSGAAVAARLCFGSIGSDTGGSIRLPAGLCGVLGLKPTHGLVSLSGGMPRCPSLDTFGPLARTARDLAVLLQAIAGYDSADRHSRAVEVPDYAAALGRPVKGLRIAVPCNHFMAETEPAIQAVHDAALAELAGLGAEIVRLAMPDPEALYRSTLIINRAEAWHIHKEWIGTRRADYNVSTIARISDGFEISAADYISALEERDTANARFEREVFTRADALWLPLLLTDTPTIAETDIRVESAAAGVVHRMTQTTRWASFVGLPVLALPIGLSPSRMPVAAQIAARRFEESRLLTIADAYQSATDWHKQRPPHSAGAET